MEAYDLRETLLLVRAAASVAPLTLPKAFRWYRRVRDDVGLVLGA
jgi:hypothetical protein